MSRNNEWKLWNDAKGLLQGAPHISSLEVGIRADSVMV